MAGQVERVADQISAWRDELVDLSRRNRLLNATGGRSSVLRIKEPAVGVILEGLDVLDSVRGRGYWRFHYPPSDDLREADPAALAALAALHSEDPEITEELEEAELLTEVSSALLLSRRLRAIERQSATEFMDKGARNLYLGIGVLRWCEAPDEWVESPLVMVPVSLDRPSPREPFRVRATDDDPVVNPALRVKMENDFAIELPELEALDDAERLIATVADRIANEVGWTVSQDVLFGRFSFQKEAMYQDLRANAEEIVASALVQAVTGAAAHEASLAYAEISDETLDEVAVPEELFSILDADSTQRRCIVAARDGATFVMDGPPGTGKSQTIANMIAELLAADKTVLFVSEKAAALDVVKSRLDQANLGSYVLGLHSNMATRKEVAQALGHTLTERPRISQSLDPDQLERVRRHRTALSAFAAAQNEVREPFGRSLHWAIGRYLQLADAPVAPPPAFVDADLTRADYGLVLDVARALAASWGPVDGQEGFLWRDLKDPGTMRSFRSQIPVSLEAAELALSAVQLRFAASAEALGLAPPLSRADYLDHLAVAELLGRRHRVPPTWLGGYESEMHGRGELIERWSAEAIRLKKAKEHLVSWGSSGSHLSPEPVDQLVESLEGLRALQLPLDINTRTGANLGAVEETLGQMGSSGEALTRAASELQATLGLTRNPDLTAVRTAISLGRIGAVCHRPESRWFDPDRLAAAKRTLGQLRPIVENYRSIVDSLNKVFNSAVFQFEAEALYDGPSDVVPKLSRTSARGRANRKQLKACSLSGKISPEVLTALPLVRQWRSVVGQLKERGPAYANELGDSYYQSSDTDLDALVEALEAAEQALRLIGSGQSPASAAEQLSVNSFSAPQIAASAEVLAGQVEAWTRMTQELVPEALVQRPVAEAAAWATQALPLVQRVRAGMDHLHGVFPTAVTVGDAASICASLWAVRQGEAAFADNDAQLRSAFGSLYEGPTTDWVAVNDASEWSTDLVRLIGRPVTESIARRLLNEEVDFGELEGAWAAADKSTEEVRGWFTGERALTVEAELHGHIADAVLFLGDLREATSQIDEWLAFEATTLQLAEMGLSEVTLYCVNNAVERSQVADVFERSILAAWIDRTLTADPRCMPFQAAERDRLVAEYQQLDRLLVANAAGRVMEVANRKRPVTIAGPFAIIRREAEKKKKHRPVRTLLEEAGAAVLALKPCFMMSPLSVSQFLPPNLHFDVVIFDEASQVRPCDAIGAIYRGSQLIVAGDNKQLPPTNFFDKASDDNSDEYDEEAFDQFESVLDLCRSSSTIGDLPLRWHYRSRHEDLITYSNRAFYASSLVTYPGSMQRGEDIGLEFLFVPDGVYGRGTSQDNAVEARKVVERVLFHAGHHPELTLGVVAFSEAQATRIQWELEAARRERPDLDPYFHEDRLDGFFIKNLESVQGDERDIIIFSIGYGRDETGKLSMNFGPLNKTGGHRRLNVAITRARSRAEVVSSIRASDISDSENPGVRHLRGYLDYAEHGAPALSTITAGQGEPESPFEVEVLATLRRWGYEAEAQVGQAGYRIDMAVRHPKHPGQWLLGVECDGAAYHSSATARDRDRLRQQVLEGLGWRLHRIWGPSWYHDRRSSEARLRTAIEEALSGKAPDRPAEPGPLPVVLERVDLSDEAIPGWVVPYRIAQLDHLQTPPVLSSPAASAAMRLWVADVVRQEGPVHPEIVVKRLREHWRAEGLRGRFRSAVDTAVASLAQQQQLDIDEAGFLSSVSEPAEASVRTPTDDKQTDRTIHEVPPVELRLAIGLLVRDAREIGAPELVIRIARIFGWKRTGPEISGKISGCIDELVRHGALQEASPGVIRGGP